MNVGSADPLAEGGSVGLSISISFAMGRLWINGAMKCVAGRMNLLDYVCTAKDSGEN